MQAFVHRLPMAHPGDVSALADLLDAGAVRANDIVGIIGKTEGNGGVNDFTRGYFTQSLMALLASHTGETASALAARIPCVLSGGTEGVLSPHFVVFSRRDGAGETQDGKNGADGDSADRSTGQSADPIVDPVNPIVDLVNGSLAIGTAFTPPLPAEAVGRWAHVLSVADAVRVAMTDAGIDDVRDIEFVQVKCPCITSARAQDAVARGQSVITTDANRSMALSRAAGAFGIALALGELPESAVDTDLLADFNIACNRASVSSGVEVTCNEVIVLGNSTRWSGPLQIAHAPMRDALDLPAVSTALDRLGIAARPQVTDADRPRIAAVLVKCEPDRRGMIRGARHTMLDDTDINAQRHIRGAVGALVAGVMGDGRLFVSGGAEHQGPDGGGLVAVIASRDAAQGI